MSGGPLFGTGLPDPRADVAGLRAFVAVARAGSVGRAANWLARAQPSISARLATLEQAWGTRLFRRVARGMSLTPEGARLLPLAEKLLREMEELDRAAGLPVRAADELRVGAGDALGRELLPRALSRLLRDRPHVEIHLREGPGPRLLEALRDGEIDLALVVQDPAPAPEGLRIRPLRRSEVSLLVPRGAARRGRMPLKSLAAERLVALQPGSGFRRHLETAFRAASLPFHPVVEVGNLSLVRRFVAAGLGVAPVPAVAFGERGRAGTAMRGLAGIPDVAYAIAVRAGVPLSGTANRLLDLLRRAGA